MSDRIMTCSAALAEALHEEMTRDGTIFILGEDLTRPCRRIRPV
jgi:pyruvate/2-oxoglutarate/acetoin dehydrogenase E1 component